MPSAFPGMDPFLENSEFWSEVHHRLITAIAIAIAPPLRPKYQVAIEKRTYLSSDEDGLLVGIPDATVFSRQSSFRSTQFQSETDLGRPSLTFVNRSNPTPVKVPLPEQVRETYLEIREGGSVFICVYLCSSAVPNLLNLLFR